MVANEIKKTEEIVDGNTAAAEGSYIFSEVAAIYPITPSSPMAENVDVFASKGRKNAFGDIVKVVEMESEAGAAGAVHGASQGGALAVTYTASQGLLLMLPNMYKWVGEELPVVVHVAARSVATEALSIFGDHSDVYAARQTGMAMLCSQSVQDVMNLAPVAHLISIASCFPIIHFFDGFRTSHEYQKVSKVPDEEWIKLLDKDALNRFRQKALNPHGNAVTRGTNQNDDIYFQTREAQNLHIKKVGQIAKHYLEEASRLTGKTYAPFVYYGDPNATEVIVAMGSVTETISEVVDDLNSKGQHVGVVKVYLYRPFVPEFLSEAIPNSVKRVAVLDRTKEPGSDGEPLYLDVLAGLNQQNRFDIRVVGGRYGLSSRDTQPKDIKGIFDFLKSDNLFSGFTVGINDDVTNLSLKSDDDYVIEDSTVRSCLFYGMGSDGTVSANKSAAKIIGALTNYKIQAYFQYGSEKAGGVTVSHIRFGDNNIHSEYYVHEADFISCSQDSYLFRYDMLKSIKNNGIFLLNTSLSKEALLNTLPLRVKRDLAKANAKFYIIDANTVARSLGLGRHTNTILESAFFYLMDVAHNHPLISYNDALNKMKEYIVSMYSKKGQEIVDANIKAVDMGTQGLEKIDVDPSWADIVLASDTKLDVNTYKGYADTIRRREGYSLPVSSIINNGVEDGTELNNSNYDAKRCVADIVPHWFKENCIQCNQCALVCPHATIRAFLLNEKDMSGLSNEEKTDVLPAIGPKAKGLNYRIQVSPMNCLGCSLCVDICPGKFDPKTKTFNKALKMVDAKGEYIHEEAANYLYRHVQYKPGIFPAGSLKDVGQMRPYHEVSGSCAGCGETQYYRLLSQLFGSDLMIANATGCSSIYCASTPQTPNVTDEDGNGIAWANSLFEDNAEYGYGMRMAQDHKLISILSIIQKYKDETESELKDLLNQYVLNLKNRDLIKPILPRIIELVRKSSSDGIKQLLSFKNDMLDKCVWIVGGDGWAYDIGYGGLDHVLATKDDVNILVLDTEVYSNTGGQASKSSQQGQVAKFAASGKKTAKKNLALLAMAYKDVYVAQISLGGNMMAAIKAMKEAESYHNGPSIVIAYCPCIEHGMKGGLVNTNRAEKEAANCGYFPIFRYDPRLPKPLTLDTKTPDFNKYLDFVLSQNRYAQLSKVNPDEAERLLNNSKNDAINRYNDIIRFGTPTEENEEDNKGAK